MLAQAAEVAADAGSAKTESTDRARRWGCGGNQKEIVNPNQQWRTMKSILFTSAFLVEIYESYQL